jgi:hypothetical protein
MMMKGNTDMLTLSDINALTNSKDGDIYSDLYKDVYGSRPRYAQFRDLEEFQDDYDFLCNKLDEQLERQQVEQARNFDEFVARVEETMQIVEGATRERAIEIIADAEGISEGEFDFYGLEILEYRFELKFGSISRWLSE